MGRPRFEKPYLITEWDGVEYVPYYAPRTSPTPIPTPGIFDEPIVCLMINDRWAAHFKGVIDALDQPDTWIGTPEEIDAARQQIREALARFSGECMVCCDEELAILEEIKVLNQTIINNQLTLITNNLTTIEQNNQTIFNQYLTQYNQYTANNTYQATLNNQYYDGDPRSIAPDIGENFSETGDPTETRLCAAIEAFINGQIATYTRQSILLAGVGGIASAAILAAAAALSVFTAGTSIIAGAAIDTAILGSLALWDSILHDVDAHRKVRCCMYDNLKGTAVSEENFQASFNDCGFSGGSNEATLAQQLSNSVSFYHDDYLAFLRFYQNVDASGDTANCECGCDTGELNIVAMNDCVVTKIDDTHYRVQQSNFTVVDIPFAGVTQVYVAQVRDEFYRCVVYTGATQAQHDYFVTDCDGNDLTGTGGGGGELVRFGWNYWTPDATPTPLDTILTIDCPA